MNPGLLLVPYLALLAYLVWSRRPALLTVWAFAFVVMPTIRNRIGPVSIYWADLAAIAVFVRFLGWRVPTPGLAGSRRWMLALLAGLSVGAVTTVVRYGAVLEPGYWMYRFALGMLPLTVLPRALARTKLLRAFANGVYAAGLCVGLVAIAQSLGGTPASAVFDLFYGGYASGLQPTGFRVYGMYYTSTAFAGGSVLVTLLALVLVGVGERRALAHVCVGAGTLATLLTYSRHGLLALLVFLALLGLLNPRRLPRTVGVAALAALLSSAFVSVDYWKLRLARGGITEDPNLRARLVQRPHEFWDRLSHDPSFGLFGVGLGLEHTLEPEAYREATYGFVSNTPLLYLVFAGVAAFLTFLGMFLTTLRRAWLFRRRLRAITVASMLGVVVILASDNYGFYNTSIWFLWASIVGMVRGASHRLGSRALRRPRQGRFPMGPRPSERAQRGALGRARGPSSPATNPGGRTGAWARRDEWYEQWYRFRDDEVFLFCDWIAPYDFESLRGKRVLEAGCGGGLHTAVMSGYAAHVTAVDLHTAELAAERTADRENVEILEDDIATMSLGVEFDVVLAIGVVHHTDDPERTVANLKRHLAPGGILILWVYSREGNWLVRNLVEPARARVLRRLPRGAVEWLARGVTASLYPLVHTLYRLPLRFLPYYEYFANFRRMGFTRNTLNVFDKLNAPQTDFISRSRAEGFVSGLDSPLVKGCRGVSYHVSGRRPEL